MACPCPIPTIEEMSRVAYLVALIFFGVVFCEWYFNVRTGGRK